MPEKNIITNLIETVHTIIKKADDSTENACDIPEKENKFIFRGENKHYGRISCTLYRAQEKRMIEIIQAEEIDMSSIKTIVKEIVHEHDIDIRSIEQNILREAKERFSVNIEKLFEIASQFQHYGGKTTLIDFTKNILIALFFACNGEPEQDGRIICFNRGPIQEIKETLYNEDYKDDAVVWLLPPTQSRDNRVIFQSSIFVHAPKGFLEEHAVEMLLIKKEEKQTYLQALQRYHDIDITTVFNDLQGFITNSGDSKTAETYHEFSQKDSKKAKILQQQQYDRKTSINRADANRQSGMQAQESQDHKKAEKYYSDALYDYNKVLTISPDDRIARRSRGYVHVMLGNCKKAQDNYTTAQQCYNSAREDLEKTLEIQPDHKETLIQRGKANIGLGDCKGQEERNKPIEEQNYQAVEQHYEDALKDFEKIFETQSDRYDIAVLINRSRAYEGLGSYNQAQGKYAASKAYYAKALQDLGKVRSRVSFKHRIEPEIQRLQEILQRLYSQDTEQ